MYNNLGIHWASSIPAFLALACVPFPFLFYKYGEPIRMKCKYAAQAAKALEEMRDGGNTTEEEGEEIDEREVAERKRLENETDLEGETPVDPKTQHGFEKEG
jgi:hypothetical protein